jgi:hypothetical protein
MTKRRLLGALLIFILQIPLSFSVARAEEIEKEQEKMEAVTKGLLKGETIELRALEIRARIYEPSVIYILDRAKLDVDYGEQKIEFAPRIDQPIEENRF